jgi:Flp pilus assembly protein TadD
MREVKDYERMNQKAKAIAQLHRATTIDPHYWDVYSELALMYKNGGDTKYAIEAASKLLAFHLCSSNQLGYWYEERGDRQKARRELRCIAT